MGLSTAIYGSFLLWRNGVELYRTTYRNTVVLIGTTVFLYVLTVKYDKSVPDVPVEHYSKSEITFIMYEIFDMLISHLAFLSNSCLNA